MIRAITFAFLAALVAAGCEAKPTEEACERAIENLREISGLARADVGADPKAAIRSCQANSSRATVDCMIAAKTMEDIVECEGPEGKKFEAKMAEEQAAAEDEDKAEVTEPAAEKAAEGETGSSGNGE